ncbi:neuromodulin isoform X1 [Carassius auratus]|uniref:Neuromodulin n=1 Tax=Carassius auratus TaxID=7957 RepID=A0A6P6LHE4_CARAU|nr:neuromodulin isoform X1 [Carassius auratus]
MLCCIRRTKPVEKNEEADQEIKQDGTKPEENAHKAATKIQASFRGHITRKKMKDEDKDGENDTAPDESAEMEEKKERVSPSEEKPVEVSTETAEESKPAEQPNSPAAEAPPTAATDSAPSDTPTKEEAQEQLQDAEEPKEAENTAAADDITTQKEEEKEEEEEEEEEEAKRADVPDDTPAATESQETDQTDKKEALDDSKPAEEAGKDQNV